MPPQFSYYITVSFTPSFLPQTWLCRLKEPSNINLLLFYKKTVPSSGCEWGGNHPHKQKATITRTTPQLPRETPAPTPSDSFASTRGRLLQPHPRGTPAPAPAGYSWTRTRGRLLHPDPHGRFVHPHQDRSSSTPSSRAATVRSCNRLGCLA